jgi:hypothetical protein
MSWKCRTCEEINEEHGALEARCSRCNTCDLMPRFFRNEEKDPAPSHFKPFKGYNINGRE